MPLTPSFCSQCGTALVKKFVEGRERDVCPICGTVFYRNPLPVASALILNENREILLVRRSREPEKGKWCLPIGFAELNETIAEAALRELHEEAGVTGKILRLLDVDSYKSDFYGDLLIVTFEAEQTGGAAHAGDDAEAAEWFPLDALPPLAFTSNENAVRACREVHADEWAIGDSFRSMRKESNEELLSNALVAFLSDNADEIARLWIDDVKSSTTTPHYRTLDSDELHEKASLALKQFGRWLMGIEAEDEVRRFYLDLGAERKLQGFQPHEVISSLALFRKNIWTFSLTQGVWTRPIEVYRVMELDWRLVLFFDRAMYHVARGFQDND